MGLRHLACCCDTIVYDVLGPFRDLSSQYLVDYHFRSPSVWPDDDRFKLFRDQSFTMGGWSVPSDTDYHQIETRLTIAPWDAAKEDGVWYELREHYNNGLGGYTLARVVGDTQEVTWERDVDPATPGGIFGDWSNWTEPFLISASGGWVNSVALPDISEGDFNVGLVAQSWALSMPRMSRWRCSNDRVELYHVNAPSAMVRLRSNSASFTNTTFTSKHSTQANQIQKAVAAGDTSPTVYSVDFRPTILSPKSSSLGCGVAPAVQWDFTDGTASPPYTVHERVRIRSGNFNETAQSINTTSELWLDVARTRSWSTNGVTTTKDYVRLNALPLFFDSSEDSTQQMCVYYFGRENMDSSDELDTHESKVVVAHSSDSEGEYWSKDIPIGIDPRFAWSDINGVVDSSNPDTEDKLFVGFEGVWDDDDILIAWKMRVIDGGAVADYWDETSASTDDYPLDTDLYDFYIEEIGLTPDRIPNHRPYVFGSNEEWIYVANFPRGEDAIADKKTSWRVRHDGTGWEQVIGRNDIGGVDREWPILDPSKEPTGRKAIAPLLAIYDDELTPGIVLHGTDSDDQGSSTETHTLTWPGSLEAGDVAVLVLCAMDEAGALSGSPDGKTWTLALGATSTDATDARIEVHTTTLDGTESGNFTVNFTAGRCTSATLMVLRRAGTTVDNTQTATTAADPLTLTAPTNNVPGFVIQSAVASYTTTGDWDYNESGQGVVIAGSTAGTMPDDAGDKMAWIVRLLIADQTDQLPNQDFTHDEGNVLVALGVSFE